MSSEAAAVDASSVTGSAPVSNTSKTNTSATPSNVVTVGEKQYVPIREGLAEILVPYTAEPAKDSSDDKKKKSTFPKKERAGIHNDDQSVFYNHIQQFNRDLSMLATRVFADEVVAQRSAKRDKTFADGKGQGKRRKGRRDDKAATAATDVPSEKQPEATDIGENEEAAATQDAQMSKGNDQTATTETSNGAAAKRKRDEVPSSAEQELATKKVRIENESPEPTIITSQPSKAPEANGNQPTTTNNQQNSSAIKIPFRILDALSATGLRALRYCKEIPQVTSVTANDLSAEAVEAIKRSVEHNGLKGKVFPILGNASGHMYYIGTEQRPTMPDGSMGKYDVIDLDPYGTAAPFIDAAVQALTDGGMLAVTCTDSAIFASVGYMEKTFAQYGGIPWRGSASHEAGLRLIIQSIATSAARYSLAIEPLLSLSIDYYTRMFIRVRKSPNEAKLLPGKTMLVHNCDHGCGSWSKQFIVKTTPKKNKNNDTIYHFKAAQGPVTTPKCEHCGFKMHVSGPMWGGYLHNPFFVQRMLDKLPELDKNVYGTLPRLEGMLDLALHEILLPPSVTQTSNTDSEKQPPVTQTPNPDASSTATTATPTTTFQPLDRLDPSQPDHFPFFTTISDLSRVMHCSGTSYAQLRGALMHLGYRTTRSHVKPGSIKTDAPHSVLWDVMRAWIRQRAPVKDGALKEGTAGYRIWKNEGRAQEVADVQDALRVLLDGDEGKIRAAMGVVEEMRVKKVELEAEEKEKEKEMGDGMSTAADGTRKRIVFDELLGKETDRKKLVRYQINPTEHWGPQARAK